MEAINADNPTLLVDWQPGSPAQLTLLTPAERSFRGHVTIPEGEHRFIAYRMPVDCPEALEVHHVSMDGSMVVQDRLASAW